MGRSWLVSALLGLASLGYGAMVDRLLSEVLDVSRNIPSDAKFILVDEDQFRTLLPKSLQPLPFLEKEGASLGPPLDDGTAIRELERLRCVGARYLVFAWPSFWWLDHYSEFVHYLSTHCARLLTDDRLVIFYLRPRTA